MNSNLSSKKMYTYHLEAFEILSENIYRMFVLPKAKNISYKPGQYLFIKFPSKKLFPFSIANAPEQNLIELHIRASDAETKEFIAEVLRSKKMEFSDPQGQSYVRKNSTRPIILIVAGTGFAPAKSILEDLFNDADERIVHLYWAVKTEEDFYLRELPLLWKEQHPNFLYTPVLTRPKKLSSSSETIGRLPDVILNSYQNFSDYEVFIFGSYALAVESEKVLCERGLPRKALFSDML